MPESMKSGGVEPRSSVNAIKSPLGKVAWASRPCPSIWDMGETLMLRLGRRGFRQGLEVIVLVIRAAAGDGFDGSRRGNVGWNGSRDRYFGAGSPGELVQDFRGVAAVDQA